MLRQRALSFIAAVVALLFLTLPMAEADVLSLYGGASPLGEVFAKKAGASVMVSGLSMAKALGLDAVGKGDTLVVSAGRSKLQLVAGAAAAWLDVELVPMAASTLQEGGDWLVESRSAIKVFNSLLVRAGRAGDLRWEGTPRPGSPDPVQAKTQPPVAPKTASATGASLKDIRWGAENDKIRAVLDYQGAKAPDIARSGNTVKVTFSSAAGGGANFSSPYSEVKVSSVNFGDRLVLEFSSSLALKEIIPLEGPPRIVIDYLRKGGSASVAGKTVPLPPQPLPPAPPPPPSRKGPKLVVIDPGHGGKDPGAVGNGLKEKDINLSISLLLAENLKKAGHSARLTRDKDVYITLQRRTDLANQWKADVFVSIHVNALPKGRHASGTEIYLMALPTDKDAMDLALIENREIAEGGGDAAKAADKKTQMLLAILGDMQQNAKINESTGFAEYLFKEGSKGGIKMRRVAQAPFFVLRGAGMPAVLVETGFITEASDAKLLADPKYRAKMAASLARGISQYLANN